MSGLHEECGVLGVFAPVPAEVAAMTYYGLFALQHRGQESCGIAVNDGGHFTAYKDVGLVNDVFTPAVMQSFGQGCMAVGHCRYGTTGSNDRVNAQPLVVNHTKGRMALAHNGNLVNSLELREALELEGGIFHTTTDSEVISYVITKERITASSVEDAVNRAMFRLKGAYSLVVMSSTKLIAARDEHGFRPLCYGKTAEGLYVVASESCALTAMGAELERDLLPGEIMVFENGGVRSLRDHCGKREPSLCVFEFIYFARPDSVIEGCSVHEARLRAGAFLALEHPVQADVVVGVPDSGIDAAIGFSRQSGIPYGVGLIKNRYIGRTFIAPGQEVRADRIRIKLNPIERTVAGKRVVLIDDSIVRGNTSGRIVHLLREAGAKEIHLRISAPPFLNPCYYGTDIDSRENLIASHLTTEEICKELGADSLGFLSVDNVTKLTDNRGGRGFCTACFSGDYPTEVPERLNKTQFEKEPVGRKRP
ncbi:MAG: amidophosphoribosyltransferase [Clostridiaceae bacterium]|nr:amidophosphoribosyltransferase [Eubacteriales bacterium]